MKKKWIFFHIFCLLSERLLFQREIFTSEKFLSQRDSFFQWEIFISEHFLISLRVFCLKVLSNLPTYPMNLNPLFQQIYNYFWVYFYFRKRFSNSKRDLLVFQREISDFYFRAFLKYVFERYFYFRLQRDFYFSLPLSCFIGSLISKVRTHSFFFLLFIILN